MALVVLAGDHSGRTAEKVGRLARAKGVPTLIGPDARELGRRIGRGPVQAIGIEDTRLASGMTAPPGHGEEAGSG